MKRFTSILLTLILFLSGTVSAVSALAVDNPAFALKAEGTLDTGKPYNGQDSLVLNWQVMANRAGLTLKNAQSLRFAYDNAVLQLMKWDGSSVIADSGIGTSLTSVSQAGRIGVYDAGGLRVYAAKNAPGNMGYLSMSFGDPFDTCTCPQGLYVSLVQVRFAFRSGKSAADLNEDSIRCLTAGELSAIALSSAILLNTDENGGTSYEYLRQEGGVAAGGDALDAPTIAYPRGPGDHGGKTDPPKEDPTPATPVTPVTPVNPDIPEVPNFVNPYSDVSPTDWYYKAVMFATEKGLVNGTGGGKFSPSTPTTRAMFATVLYRLAGQPSITNHSTFSDVADGQWYTDAIWWANGHKIIMGYGNNRFGTNDIITREQAVTLLYRYSELLGLGVSSQADISTYTDASQISEWALSAMRWAVGAGIISGRTPTTLVPQGQMTRSEVVQILMNYL